jgi:hypothetical protein
MSGVSSYSSSSVSSYYNNAQTQVQAKTQAPQDDFSQILNMIGGGSSGGQSAGGVDGKSGASGWSQGSSDFSAALDKMLFSSKTQELGGKGGKGGFKQDMDALATAIGSGDMDAAKKALATIEAHKPKDQASSSTQSATAQSTTGADQRTQDFDALKKALDAGDQTAAKSVLATIQDHMKQGQAHGKHGHHGQQAASATSSTDTSSTQNISTKTLVDTLLQRMLSQYTSTQATGVGSLQSISA